MIIVRAAPPHRKADARICPETGNGRRVCWRGVFSGELFVGQACPMCGAVIYSIEPIKEGKETSG